MKTGSGQSPPQEVGLGLDVQAGEYQPGNVLRQAGPSAKSGFRWQAVDGA